MVAKCDQVGFLSKVKTLLPLRLTLREYNVIVGQNAGDQITQTSGGSRVGARGTRPPSPLIFSTYVQKCMQWRKWRNWRKIASRWRFELDAKSGPLEAGDFGDFGKNRHACNGENGETGEKSPASGYLNWMPKVAPWRLASLAKMVICDKIFKLDAKSGPFKVDN